MAALILWSLDTPVGPGDLPFQVSTLPLPRNILRTFPILLLRPVILIFCAALPIKQIWARICSRWILLPTLDVSIDLQQLNLLLWIFN